MLHFTSDYTTGTLITVDNLTPWTYLLSQASVIVHYLRLCFWPQDQCIDYGWPAAHSIAEVWPQAVVVMMLLVATIWCIFRHPKWSFLGGWFFLILAPTSSIIPIKDLAFEHRMYLPSVAVIAAAVLGVFHLGRRVMSRGMLSSSAVKLLGASVAVAVVLQLGMAAYGRNCVYATELALWRDAVAKVPANPRARYNLGTTLGKSGLLPEALEQYQEVIRIKPDYAEAHNNLGNALAGTGHAAEAMEHYREAIRIDPEFADPHNNLGIALVRSGHTAEAIEHFHRAIDLAPGDAQSHTNLGNALGESGREAEAIKQYREAIRIDPNNADAHCNLGVALAASGLSAEVIAQFQQAIRIKPDLVAAHYYLARCHVKAGHPAEAIGEYEQSLRLVEAAGQTQLARTILNEIRRLEKEQSLTSGKPK